MTVPKHNLSVWSMANGTKIRVSDMTCDHIKKCLSMLYDYWDEDHWRQGYVPIFKKAQEIRKTALGKVIYG